MVREIGCPNISVVIPAYNEEVTIGACLTSLGSQTYDGPVEIIVVDNGSDDATGAIARSFGATVICEPTRGVCQARETGTRAARGAIVVSTDADTVFDPTWLSRIALVMHERPEVVATCGPCRFLDAPWWGGPYARILFGFVAAYYRLFGRVLYASATNIAFRRSSWRGYDLGATQGGDELGLLRSLRSRGRVHFDLGTVTLTSSRRLRRGLIYNIFITCLYFYLIAYNVNRLVGRPVLGTAPVIREDGTRRSTLPARTQFVTVLAAVGLAVVAYWLTPLAVDVL